ncbi:MAG: SHOCT domain-containing protein [Candidatus Methanoperedens sp.]|nr:SHOCT domain-containing protein [Candidatus Methanoperedens sp.]
MQLGMMNGFGSGMGSGMWIFGLIFWILIVAGLILLIKYLWEGGGARKEESALDILKKKYARGEISKEEFNEKKKDIL